MPERDRLLAVHLLESHSLDHAPALPEPERTGRQTAWWQEALRLAGPLAGHADPYRLAPAPKTLLTLYGAEHLLGGISGYDADETTDESPERVTALARLTSAYLRTQLQPGDHAWQEACEALTTGTNTAGRVESK